MKPFSIVGILNTTPDSYFDGGEFMAVERAVSRAGEMLAEGADIIEIGGESTGPGSPDVSEADELKRVLPIIDAIRSAHPTALLSIDTWKSAVAKEAVARGVSMVNDVTAGRSDPNMFATLAESDATLVLMYSKDSSPRTTKEERQYEDVVWTITTFLEERISAAERAGIDRSRIIIDPGLGHFVSSLPEYSFEIIARLREFTPLAPIFISPSRKSFLAGKENLPASERLPATIAASALAVANGATYIRTHDVRAVRQGCEVAAAF